MNERTTWRRANVREVWTWVGVGAAGVMGVEVLGLLTYGVWVTS